MKNKFFNPYTIWLGIWLLICLMVVLISLQANKLYWQAGIMQERLASQRGSGVFSRQFGLPRESGRRAQFLSRYHDAFPPLDFRPGASSYLKPEPKIGEDASLYSLSPASPSFLDSLWDQYILRRVFQSGIYAGYYFIIVSYLFFIVGFGAICLITAIYQSHFHRAQEEQFAVELEARNLRIQALEYNRNALDLRITLLDQVHERTQAAAQEAQKTIADLEQRLQSQADRNEELQEELEKARQEESAALRLLRVLDDDRQKIAAEQTDILSRLAEAEQIAAEGLHRQRTGKAQRRLRLNSSWLTSHYKNLSFSPRALQNLNEIQDAPDVFPSLPDALGVINHLTPEALKSGAGLPPKSLARFATHDLEHFRGPFWEYRFSADGRIFFGLSRSRTINIDTILLKRRFPDKKEKYDRYLAATLGKDNRDLRPEPIS